MIPGMHIAIEPWTEDDLPLLRAGNTPEATKYLGGPESEQKLLDRHRRYVEGNDMYRIVLLPEREAVGSLGYWDKEWQGEQIYEAGWGILPQYRGRGIASGALDVLAAHAANLGSRPYLHAFPSVENLASNAVCRKVGFELLGEHDFEYPPGHWMRCNDWRLDLSELR
jgi:RimJ/RimL family protein N-acetyltransferase